MKKQTKQTDRKLMKICPSSTVMPHTRGNGSSNIVNPKLHFDKYQEYFDAILTNDVASIDDILKGANNREKLALLNGEFEYDNVNYMANMFGGRRIVYRINKPLHLAVCFHCFDVAELMLGRGVDKQGCDVTGHNVMHSLVSAARLLPSQEDNMCAAYEWLVNTLHTDVIYKLMTTENYHGYRPVEYAMQQDCLKLCNAFLLTSGCYVTSEQTQGIASYKKIDVTEYESGNRFDKSPMLLLAFMNRSKLTDASSTAVLFSPVFSAWISAKIQCNYLAMTLWFFLRLVVMVTYLVFDKDTGLYIEQLESQNITAKLCDEALSIQMTRTEKSVIGSILFFLASASVIFDVFDTIRYFMKGIRTRHTDLMGKKHTVIDWKFYRFGHLLMSLTLITIIPITFNFYAGGLAYSAGGVDLGRLYIDITRATLPLSMIWSLLFFFQCLPSIGNAVLSIQNMLGDMIHFYFLYILLLFPFVHIFTVFISFNSLEGCIDDFADTTSSLYSLFKMMLNMVDLKQYDIKSLGILYAMHMLYVFMVAVLLLNFLIAVMSTSAANISGKKKVLFMITRLSLAIVVEERLRWIAQRYYRHVRKRFYATEGDRVYVTVFTNRMADLAKKRQTNIARNGQGVLAKNHNDERSETTTAASL